MFELYWMRATPALFSNCLVMFRRQLMSDSQSANHEGEVIWRTPSERSVASSDCFKARRIRVISWRLSKSLNSSPGSEATFELSMVLMYGWRIGDQGEVKLGVPKTGRHLSQYALMFGLLDHPELCACEINPEYKIVCVLDLLCWHGALIGTWNSERVE